MKDENILAAAICPAARLADELGRGARLIDRIDEETYRRKTERSGSVGAHFRHNLEFAELFLKGIATGQIDYTARERDAALEEDRDYAINRYDFAEMRLRRLPAGLLNVRVLVRSEIDPDIWHVSSYGRELEFIHSHTVHHHALIVEKLAFMGVSTEFGFGVAPSTLKFWAKENSGAEAASRQEKIYDYSD